jgi:hypothetical protein
MSLTLQSPAGIHVGSSQESPPGSTSPTTTVSLPYDAAERRPVEGSFIDMCKVAAFLVLALVARSSLTAQHTSPVEGASEPPAVVADSVVEALPDLMDLSTVGF